MSFSAPHLGHINRRRPATTGLPGGTVSAGSRGCATAAAATPIGPRANVSQQNVQLLSRGATWYAHQAFKIHNTRAIGRTMKIQAASPPERPWSVYMD